jgi:hypothetical protein
MGMRKTVEQRFWEKVDASGDCWLWTAACLGRTICNYGVFRFQGKRALAHRVSYEMRYGPVSQEIKVLHRCDNPVCVNPSHLFLGTQSDNLADMRIKGRDIRAKECPASRTCA